MKPKTSFAEQAASTLAKASIGAEEPDAATDERIVLAKLRPAPTCPRAQRRQKSRPPICPYKNCGVSATPGSRVSISTSRRNIANDRSVARNRSRRSALHAEFADPS